MPNHTSLYANTGIVTMLVPLIRTADAVPADGSGMNVADCDDAVILFLIGANGDTYSSTDKLSLKCRSRTPTWMAATPLSPTPT